MTLTWAIEVKWNGVNYINEAGRATNLTIKRGRDYLFAPGGKGLEPMQIGEAVVTLENYDGRYDPYNTGSPLSPNVTPGKYAKIAVTYTPPGTTNNLMRGIVSDIQPVNRGRNAKVRLVVKDALGWIADKVSKRGLTQDVPLYELVYFILGSIGYPFAEWGYGGGDSVEMQSYYWAWQVNALQAIHDLENLEFGTFFIDRWGLERFWGRHHSYAAATVVTQDLILDEIGLPQPWEIVRNRSHVGSHAKILDPINAILWQLEDIPLIAAGSAFTIIAQFSWDTWKPCGSGIHFTHLVNTRADGMGADLTAQCPLTNNPQIGDGAEITITNNTAPPVTGYVILLKTTGDAIYPPSDSVLDYEDATSISTYGPKDVTIDSYFQEDSWNANNYAHYLVTKFKDPKLYPVIQFEDRPTYQFPLDLLSLVNLQVAKYSINGNFRVGKIEHKWLRENGQAVRTTLKLEPYIDPAEGYWTLGTSQLGISTVLGF